MIHVLASVRLRQGAEDAFIETFKANIPNVLAEEGCLAYEPTRDLPTEIPIQETDPGTITIVEKWESLEALQAHLAAPHMAEYRKNTEDLVESVSVKILESV